MLCWLQLMQAKKWVVITPLPAGSPLACNYLPIKIYPASYLTEQLHRQSASQPAVFIQTRLRNTMVRNTSANQGHMARTGARAPTKLEGWWGCNLEQAGDQARFGDSKELISVQFQEDPKGEGFFPWSSPAAPFSTASLQPLQGTLLCCFQSNGQKHTAKKLHTQRQNLLLCPGNFGH